MEKESALRDLLGSIVEALNWFADKDFYGASITRVAEDGRSATIVASQGLDAVSRARVFRPGEGFVGSLWAKGTSDQYPDVTADARFSGKWRPRCRLPRSVAAVHEEVLAGDEG